MDLELFPERLVVWRRPPHAAPPTLPDPNDGFYAVVRDGDELSIVTPESDPPTANEPSQANAQSEGGWRRLRVAGTLDFSLVGILADLSAALAEAGVSIFAISSYDTDHLLVKDDHLARAIVALESQGHRVIER